MPVKIHIGFNKNLSNNTIVQNYRIAVNGMTEYHKFVSEVNIFCLSSFLLLIVGQNGKIQISKLQYI